MNTKNKYLAPESEHVTLNTKDKVMQDHLQNHFSGGDALNTAIVIDTEANFSEEDNRTNQWGNYLWEE